LARSKRVRFFEITLQKGGINIWFKSLNASFDLGSKLDNDQYTVDLAGCQNLLG
jgi:hypothetical protein